MEKKSWTQEKKRFEFAATSIVDVPSDDRTVAGDRGRKRIETKMSGSAEFRPLRRPLQSHKDGHYEPGKQQRRQIPEAHGRTKDWWNDIPQKQPPSKRHSNKHNQPSEVKEVSLSSLKLGSKMRNPDAEGYMPGRKPALEADVTALMGRKRPVAIADYASKIGGGAPGSKPFAAPEYSSGFFHHPSGSIPGSNIRPRGADSHKEGSGIMASSNQATVRSRTASSKNNAEFEEPLQDRFKTYEQVKRAQLLRAEIDEVLKLEAPATTAQVGMDSDDSDDDLL